MMTLLEDTFRQVKKGFMVGGGNPGIEFLESDALHANIPTVQVSSYSGLIRVVGYVRHTLGRHGGTRVLFRGQGKTYATADGTISIPPTAYRKYTTKSARRIYINRLDSFLAAYRAEFKVDPKPEHQTTTEPVFQHYGYDTRWIDVVDSIPHALFFSVHERQENSGLATYTKRSSGFGYLYILAFSGLNEQTGGYWQSGSVHLCDLRTRKTSLIARPHAQHGLLCMDSRYLNLGRRVALQLSFPIQKAREWIGGDAFQPKHFFPNKQNDPFYGSLLNNEARLKSLCNNISSAFNPGHIQQFAFHT